MAGGNFGATRAKAVAKRKKTGIAWKFGVFNGLLWVEKGQSLVKRASLKVNPLMCCVVLDKNNKYVERRVSKR